MHNNYKCRNYQFSMQAERIKFLIEEIAQNPEDPFNHYALGLEYQKTKPQEAKELCLRSLEFFKNYGTKAFLATLNYRLALAEEALGEHEAARKHAKDALDWFERLGMRPDYVDGKDLVERLEA